ncbi:TIGR02206 family membrane protein [Oceanihabitans sediminis]|uniref:YwaF family protein n=1 Tax=Oceanihabitans sediminis TaxID=1812012 RepID=UPI00299EAD2F|nr:TIGR02206 family membrane protein [Oceanihabitans sediminis]MDX1774313.1 TIGR02206 family membrane protein [Oceanihabitans sediminis]
MNLLQVLVLNTNRVTIGSVQHILPILIATLFCVFIIRFSNRNLSVEQKQQVFKYFGVFVSGAIITYHSYLISLGNYSITTDLPLFLCSFLALIIPIFTFSRKYWMFEILLFWVIAGTTQGVLTPDIAVGFPSFDYFRYWIVHLGLLTIIFYAVFALRMRPRFKSIFKSFMALQVYVVVIMAINYFLKSNYFYLNRKPASASALDYLGDWPYYLLVVELILIPFFLLIYLPFYLTRNKSNKNSK